MIVVHNGKQFLSGSNAANQCARSRKGAMDVCGGEVTDLETMQICLRKYAASQCQDEECVKCVTLASPDRRVLYGASAYMQPHSRAPMAFFAILIFLITYWFIARCGH